jgi:hypothetical protein
VAEYIALGLAGLAVILVILARLVIANTRWKALDQPSDLNPPLLSFDRSDSQRLCRVGRLPSQGRGLLFRSLHAKRGVKRLKSYTRASISILNL